MITSQDSIFHDGIEYKKGMIVFVNTPDGVVMDKVRGCYVNEDGEPSLALVVRSWVLCEDVVSAKIS
jgi:hypothetical protein